MSIFNYNPKLDALKDVENQYENYKEVLKINKNFQRDLEILNNDGSFKVKIKKYERQHKNRTNLKSMTFVLLISFFVALFTFSSEILEVDNNGLSIFFAIYSLIVSVLLFFISFKVQYSEYEKNIYDIYYYKYDEIFKKHLGFEILVIEEINTNNIYGMLLVEPDTGVKK